MKYLTALATTPFFFATSAGAFEKYEELRILGSEIISLSAPDIIEAEAPATLILTVGWEADSTTEITIESDNYLKDCEEAIRRIIGESTMYIQITIDKSASTMNGVLVLECSTRSGLFPYPE